MFRVDRCGGRACPPVRPVPPGRGDDSQWRARRRASTPRRQLAARSGRRTGVSGGRASDRCPPQRDSAATPSRLSRRRRARRQCREPVVVFVHETLDSRAARANRPCCRRDASAGEADREGRARAAAMATASGLPRTDPASRLRQAYQNCASPRSPHLQRSRAVRPLANRERFNCNDRGFTRIDTPGEDQGRWSVSAPGVFDAGPLPDHRGELPAGEVGERHVLEHGPQAGA